MSHPYNRRRPSLGDITWLLLLAVGTGAVIEQQYYGATSSAYINFASSGYNLPPMLLLVKQLGRITRDSLALCFRSCISNANCRGFVKAEQNGQVICYLQAYDRCASPTPLVFTAGVQSYDLRRREDPLLPLTCQQRCISSQASGASNCSSSGTCSATYNSTTDCSNNPYKYSCVNCGRPNCCGRQCEVCPRYCWELPILTSSLTSVWLWPNQVMRAIQCEGYWMGINKFGGQAVIFISGDFGFSPGTSLWLKIVVTYANSERLVSYFDHININNANSLMVGNYLGGSAGNYWGAPFTGRAFFMNATSNCLPFYHASNECNATGVPSYEEQIAANATTIQRGLSWLSECRPDLQGVRVTNFLFFVSTNLTALDAKKLQTNITDLCSLT